MAHHFLSLIIFKDGTAAEAGTEMVAAARRMLTSAEAVTGGPVTAVRNTDRSFDLVIDVTFADEAAFRAAIETPETRQYVIDYMRPNADTVIHVNYDETD